MTANERIDKAKLIVLIPIFVLLAAAVILVIFSFKELDPEEADRLISLTFKWSLTAVAASSLSCGIAAKALIGSANAPAWMDRLSGIEIVVGGLLALSSVAFWVAL